MTNVPFEQLGPGQVGRAVFQVIGQDGPVFNPSKIRYLPLSDAPSAEMISSDALSASTALAGANLIASVGSVALSAETLRQVRLLHDKIDLVTTKIGVLDQKLDRLLQKVARIDARVAENSLRHALDHLVRLSISGDEVDLHQLARLRGDLLSLIESIEDWSVGGSTGLQLATDTADKLDAISGLLVSVRHLTLAAYNVAAGGHPSRAVRVDPVKDYLLGRATTEFALLFAQLLPLLGDGREALKEDVHSHFSFASSADVEHYHEFFDEQLIGPAIDAMSQADNAAFRVLTPLRDRIVEVESVADRRRLVDDYFKAWLWGSHAGLIWRTFMECEYLSLGYLSRNDLDPAVVARLTVPTVSCRIDADAIAAMTEVPSPKPFEAAVPANRASRLAK